MKKYTKSPLLSFFFFMFFYCVFHSHTYSQSLKSELLNTDSIRMETTINSIHELQKRYNYTSLNVYKAGKHYTLSTNQSIYGLISGIIATKLATNKNTTILAIPFGILSVTFSISSLYNKITGNRYLINSRYSEYVYQNSNQQLDLYHLNDLSSYQKKRNKNEKITKEQRQEMGGKIYRFLIQKK